MSGLYLAADAGGSRVTYVLADAERVLARTESATIKRIRVSAEIAAANLKEAFAALESTSGRKLAEVTRSCVGTSGWTVPQVGDFIRESWAGSVGGELELVGDIAIALDAAFQGGRGALALAGTGSNVAARSADGTIFVTGGYGPALGDQGSADWIGKQALREVFLTPDERNPAPFLRRVMERWETRSLDMLIAKAHAEPPPDFARLSIDVAELAKAGDAVCAGVLERGGRELAAQVLHAICRVREQEPEATDFDPPAVACAGSILHYVDAVRAAMTDELRRVYPTIQVLPGVIDPVMGALWRARNSAA